MSINKTFGASQFVDRAETKKRKRNFLNACYQLSFGLMSTKVCPKSSAQHLPAYLSAKNSKHPRNLCGGKRKHKFSKLLSKNCSKGRKRKAKIYGIFLLFGAENLKFCNPARSLLSHKFTSALYTVMNLQKSERRTAKWCKAHDVYEPAKITETKNAVSGRGEKWFEYLN